jgi:sarcosine oxidase delta subunit
LAVLATVACPYCDAEYEIEYVRLGAPSKCPACGEAGVAEVPVGGRYPMRNYEMTFRSFEQLISFEPYRKEVEPFLLSRGLHPSQPGPDTTLIRATGEPIGLLEAHLEIQSDPYAQREIYQVAMSVWR